MTLVKILHPTISIPWYFYFHSSSNQYHLLLTFCVFSVIRSILFLCFTNFLIIYFFSLIITKRSFIYFSVLGIFSFSIALYFSLNLEIFISTAGVSNDILRHGFILVVKIVFSLIRIFQWQTYKQYGANIQTIFVANIQAICDKHTSNMGQTYKQHTRPLTKWQVR